MDPNTIIPAFDQHLHEQGLRFEAVVIGGAALNLLGVIVRPTDDCDVLDPSIPAPVLRAAEVFASAHGLAVDWLNCKSHDFVQVPGCMPVGWRDRLRPLYQGQAFLLQTLGRQDLLCTKLVALVDRGIDLDDCVALKPSIAELKTAWPFIEQYEGNDESREVYWIPLAKQRLTELCRRLGIDGLF